MTAGEVTISARRDCLEHFLDAQAGARGVGYEQALAELRAGRELTHWIWYVLPQVRALGRSAMAREFGITDAEEAAAYAAHPVLGPRPGGLREGDPGA